MAMAAEREHEARWVGHHPDPRATDATRYAETYRAISSPASDGRSANALWLVALVAVLVALLALVVERRPASVTSVGTRPARPAPAIVARPDASRRVSTAAGPDVIGTTPREPKQKVRVGEVTDFAISATGFDLRYAWTVDGRPAGTGPRLTFVPTPDEIGRRQVEVTVRDRQGAARYAWTVHVDRPRAPRITAVEPADDTVEAPPGTRVKLRLDADSATGAEQLETAWTVDGRRAGGGNAFTVRTPANGSILVRADVRSDLGAATSREWRIAATPPPPPPPPAPVAVATAPPPAPVVAAPAPAPVVATPREPEAPAPVPTAAREAPTPPRVAAPASPPPPSAQQRAKAPVTPAARTASPPPPVVVARPVETPTPPPHVAALPEPSTPPAPAIARVSPAPPAADVAPRGDATGAPGTAEVQRWLQRYVAAWRAHDVESLRRMGQVTNDDEVEALRTYFDKVEDLDVEVNLLAVHDDGERTTIRFTRRDRFRDPAGRLVVKESPPLEKQIVRTSGGLRFVRPRG